MNATTPSHSINLRYARAEPDSGGGGGGAAPPAAAGGSDGAVPAGAGSGAPPTAAPTPRIEKVKFKINGKEVEQELPYEKLVALAQKGHAADETFRKAAADRADALRIQKENEHLQQLVLKDPIAAMRQLRQRSKDATSQEEFDEVKFLTEQLEQRLNDAERFKDPKERRIAELEEEKRQRDEEKQRELEEKEQAEHVAKVQQRKEEFAQIFTEALKHVKLPQNPFTLESMAKQFMAAKKHLPPGMKPDPQELAEVVQQDLAEVVEKGFEGIEGEDLLKLFPSLTKRIYSALKARVTKAPTGGQNATTSLAPQIPTAKPAGGKPPETAGEKRQRTPWDLKTI